MHSIRSAAFRNLARASRTALQAPRTASVPLRTGLAPSAFKVASVPAARHFSQTIRRASTEDENRAATGEQAVETSDATEQSYDQDSSSSSTPAYNDSRPSNPTWPSPHGIFIRNLVFDLTDAHVEEAFGKYGEVVHANIVRDARGLSRGYGFVYFKNLEDMNLAISDTDGTFWHGRRITVAPRNDSGGLEKRRTHRSEKVQGPTLCVYVGNIPFEATDDELNNLFRSLKGVSAVRIAVDRTTGWPRGFAHADFNDIPSAVAAYNYLSTATIGGRTLRADWAAPAEKKGSSMSRRE